VNNQGMAGHATENIRNIALAGHAGSGKTTLAEAMLFAAGAIREQGAVDKGTTVSDFDALEQKHRHSLGTSVMHLSHGDSFINLLDTPGYPDFIGPALAALRAVETVAVVVNAQAGVESAARRIMEWSREQKLCRIIVVNKTDAADADLAALYESIRENFGAECLAINLPGGGDVVDCFFDAGGKADFSTVEDAHTAIIDQVVEVDEALMEVYLDKGAVPPAQLHDAFEQALREGHLVPVCFVSAQSGAGVKALLDIIDKLLPNPMEGNPPPFIRVPDGGEGEGGAGEERPVQVKADAEGHVLAHVFKVSFDPFVGKFGIIRVHQGSVTRDSQLFTGAARKAFKVGNFFQLQGGATSDGGTAIPGDIRAIAKVDEIAYDDVLHDSHDEDAIRMARLPLPAPMAGLAISARQRGDEQKIAEALNKVAECDPCLCVERNPGGETVLRGIGDLHLRIALERMGELSGVEVDTARPSVPYLETITRAAEGHCRHKKQTGGAGQFGEVFLKVEPLARGAGFEFVNKITGGVIPSQFIPAVEKGVRQVLDGGAFAGFPLVDARVTVYDGKHHPVDSKEVAFVTAGKKAFTDAVGKAAPVVLEPIVALEITIPGGNMGDVTGDLSSRRGRVSDTESLAGGMTLIRGQAPLAEMDDYQSRLKSITGGEGSFSMQLSGHEKAPADVQKKLHEAFKPGGDD